MTSKAKAGIGTQLLVGDGASPEAFTAIAEIRNIGGPQITNPQQDATTLESSAKEFISALAEPGTVPFELLWINTAQQQQIFDDVAAGTQRSYRITLPTSPVTTFNFAAQISEFSLNVEPESPIAASITLQTSGAVTRS